MTKRRLKEAEHQPAITEDLVGGPWNEHRDDATAEAPQPTSPRLTPVDIQQKEFRLAFRGYNEHEVDAFLDQVTVELARLYEENRRLDEELAGYQGTAPATGTSSHESASLEK
jgi:DivIVA domain-containing protein